MAENINDGGQAFIRRYWAQNHSARIKDLDKFVQCPLVTCADGFQMSVQASEFHYCTPRFYEPDGNYSAWEIGFPTQPEDLIMDWAEEPSSPTQTVYGYVPTSVVDQVIAKHGGLAPVEAR